jgi:hypothetical protein
LGELDPIEIQHIDIETNIFGSNSIITIEVEHLGLGDLIG